MNDLLPEEWIEALKVAIKEDKKGGAKTRENKKPQVTHPTRSCAEPKGEESSNPQGTDIPVIDRDAGPVTRSRSRRTVTANTCDS